MLVERTQRIIRKLAVLTSENEFSVTARFIARRIKGDNDPMEVRFFGRSLWLRPGTPDMEIAYSSLSGEFDGLREVLDSESPGLIIDAGGYIGTAALALSELFPNAKVVTIEPSDENISVLSRNISANKRISAIHGALVPEGHVGAINLVDRGAGQWGFTLGEHDEAGQVNCTAEPITIADLLKFSGMKKILILKMDIEGAERELLVQSKNWLPKTDVLFVELHPDIHPDIVDAYNEACVGRRNFEPDEEKYLSVR